MKILRNLFRFSLLVFVLICFAGIQLNYVSSTENTDNSLIVNNDHRPDGEIEGVWCPSGRLASIDHRPDGEIEGVWCPSGRLASIDHRPDGEIEGVWCPSGRLA